MQEYTDKIQLLGIELTEYSRADTEYKIVISTVFSLARELEKYLTVLKFTKKDRF